MNLISGFPKAPKDEHEDLRDDSIFLLRYERHLLIRIQNSSFALYFPTDLQLHHGIMSFAAKT